jgi:hypothetical protein
MAATSLHDVFESLRDPRSPLGRRRPLSAILSQMAVAMLAGARSLEAVAQFGRDRGAAFAAALGYTHEKTPCKATFHNVLEALGVKAFESALRRWLVGRRQAGWSVIAIDGKTLCGATGEKLPGVHLLAAYAHRAGTAPAQMAVKADTNEHKAALKLLDVLPMEGAVVTGDAMFCQRGLSEKAVKKGAIPCGP